MRTPLPRTCGHPYLGDADNSYLGHAEAPYLGHADATCLGRADTPYLGHADTPYLGHADAPYLGHADVPYLGHADTPYLGHADVEINLSIASGGARDWEDAKKRRTGCIVFFFVLNRIHPKHHIVARMRQAEVFVVVRSVWK